MIYKKMTCLKFLFLLLSTCFINAQSPVQVDKNLGLIPTPHQLIQKKGHFQLSGAITVGVNQTELEPIAKILINYLNRIAKVDLDFVDAKEKRAKIQLKINKDLKPNSHSVKVGKIIELEGQSYEAVANAVASLVQLVKNSEKGSSLPRVTITDSPKSDFRSVMLDLARFWHPTETIKETIDLLWLYKIKYLSLHLSDNKRFTFPLENYPKVNKTHFDGSREFYTKDELKDLVDYAKKRGVTIIPEIEVPGHSGVLWSTYPEIFGSVDEKTSEAKPLYVVNMAKESTYLALNEIISEVAEVFYNSPYLHVGGDEVYLENLKKVPEYQEYTSKHNLQEAAKGDANELFCHFINRMNSMVKAQGKKTIIWEGFHGTGSKNLTVDKDITVIVWNTTYNHPQNLLDNGYHIVNSTWMPWYMVGAMNFAPTQKQAYSWKPTQWSHWQDSIEDIEVNSDKGILGGQISFWEQNHFKVIPVLRKRVPILAAHLWSGGIEATYDEFSNTLDSSDKLYGKLFRPITFNVQGLLNEADQRFKEKLVIEINSKKDVEYKWSFSNSWNLPNMGEAKTYETPIEIERSGILTVQAFSAGVPIGHPIQEYYEKVIPAYSYKLYGPLPKETWSSVPDLSSFKQIREGVTGFMSNERLDKINGELFAKVERDGHIDTRFYGVYNPYIVELKGNLSLPESATYTFRLTTDDGLANIYIDGKQIAKGTELKKVSEDFTVNLSKGEHTLRLEYFYSKIQNQLNLKYKTDKMDGFLPFERLVTPLKN
ncbi:family 20 glycosylhydrolase [Zobellia roscoffensis]|uniref:family 20 glycosylhydrolase n=2 Tax=Zobellia roscoffensis TaxID=2779508 RepID=UPI00188DC19A|nr:family 20 glycosylhydrolase [Zobellia roscoffensis]